ncbi:MAG: O-antigen ligase family protein [Chitinophagaceae bacterium]
MATAIPVSVQKAKEDNLFLRNIILFQGAGVLLGLGVLPAAGLILAVTVVIGLMVSRITQRRLPEAIQLLMILHFLQPYLRTYAKSLPYFFVELSTIIFVMLYLREYATQTVTELRTVLTLMAVYFVIEVVSYTEYSEWMHYRAVLGNSLALTMLVYAGVKRTKVVLPIEKIIRILLLSGALLAGVILSAHLRGNIEYDSESNFEASNGMGPVQLSFYLALTAFLFFYKFFNESDSKQKIFYVSQMLLVAGLSALTFSRGGLYFLGAYTAFYLFFNRHKFSKAKNSTYMAIVFVPMLFFAYSTVLNITGEKVVERFEEEGTGNRDVLLDYGIQIFQENPALGVGTSGFFEYVSQPRLWGKKSGAHNEFVRSLAEHGMLGGIIYFGFVIACFVGIKARRLPLDEKSVYYIFMFSYIAGTIHNGQKIGLQCFMVFLAISPLTSNVFKNDPSAEFKPRPFNKPQANLVPKA